MLLIIFGILQYTRANMKPKHSLVFKISLCLGFVFSNLCLNAQTTVHGTVIDATSGQPLVGATVAIEGVPFQVQSDEEGHFKVFVPESGKAYKVTAGQRVQRFYLVREDNIVLPMPPENMRGLVHPFSQKTVEGVVLDTAGMPLAQASVEMEGTSFRVQTDSAGRFRIYIPPLSKGFLVKHGKIKAQFPLGPGHFFTLKMGGNSISPMQETAIDQELLRSTTATISLREKSFNQGRIADPIELVQGKVAGLAVAKAGSNPNEEFDMRIRGLSTFSQRPSPLIVVDGLPESDLQAIDPFNIESITVLKDAASASKYGIRGSAGVVEIATKQAGENRLGIDYQAFAGAESIDYYWPVADAAEFRKLGGTDLGGETNWQKEVTKSAFQHAHHLSLHGKKGGTAYRIGLGYRSINGTIKGTGYDNLNGIIFLSQSALKNRLQITARLGANRRMEDHVAPSVLHHAIISNPTAPVYDDQSPGGYFVFPFFSFNPVALLEQNKRQDRTLAYTGQLRAKLDIWKGIYLTGHYAAQKLDFNSTIFSGEFSPLWRSVQRGLADQQRLERLNHQWGAHLGYEVNFSKININAEAGINFQRIKSTNINASLTGISLQQFSQDNLENIEPGENQSSNFYKKGDKHDLEAGFARLGATYEGWVFLDVNFRREGSSRLGENGKWGNFYGISAAADLGHWMEARWVNLLKPRLSFGKTGNVPDLPYLSQRIVEENSFVYLNGQWVPGFFIVGVENPDLKWERKREWNFGLDAAFIGNRIIASLDFYRSTNDDLLRLERLFSDQFERGDLWENRAALQSKGHELSLEATLSQQQGFMWQVGLQYAKSATTVKELGGENNRETQDVNLFNNPSIAFLLEEGKPVGQFYGLETVNGNPEVFKDMDNDGNNCFCESDYGKFGHALPATTLGFSNRFLFNKLELSLAFRGAYGHYLLNNYRVGYETPFVFNENSLQTDGYTRSRTLFNVYSDYYVEKASFTRLQYATIAYTFDFAEKSPLKSLRLSLTGNNLITFTKYQGADPEVRYDYQNIYHDSPPIRPGQLNPLILGVDDYNTWLPTRTVVVGIRAGF